jgi:hypothetical protein
LLWKKNAWTKTRKRNAKKKRNILGHLESAMRQPFYSSKEVKLENCQNYEEVMRRIRNTNKKARMEVVNDFFKKLSITE